MDDPGPLPPKLVFLDHFFGENVLFHQFDPTNTPTCYTWLESYGSSLRDGKNKKNIFSSCEASDFRGRSQTDFLHDLEARHILEGRDDFIHTKHIIVPPQIDCCKLDPS